MLLRFPLRKVSSNIIAECEYFELFDGISVISVKRLCVQSIIAILR